MEARAVAVKMMNEDGGDQVVDVFRLLTQYMLTFNISVGLFLNCGLSIFQ